MTRRRGIAQLAPAVAATLAYAPNLDDYYVSDDFDHPFVQGWSLDALWAHLTEPAAAGDFFRPLTRVSMAIDHALWGATPEPSHVVNVLLHATCAWLVGRLALALTEREAVGSIAGVLFALHPIHPEAVSFLGARFDLLAGTFAAAALLAHVRAAERGSGRGLAASTALFVASILSKEAGLFVPVAVLAYELLCARERRLWRALPTFVALGAYAAYRVFVIGAAGGYRTGFGESRHIPTLDAAYLEQLFGFVGYGLVTPVNASALGGLALGLGVALGALFVALALTATMTRTSNWRVLLFALASTLAAALPASTLYSTWGLMHGLEGARFLYAPSIPFCVGLAVLLDELRPRALRRFALGAQLLLYGGLCLAHALVWSHASSLSRGVVETTRRACADLAGPEPTVLVYGAPDNYLGAFVLRNGIPAAVEVFHPRHPVGRFFRPELEPDFVEGDGFDVRDAVGRSDVCALVWDSSAERLVDATPALRAAERRASFEVPSPRGEGERWWEDWTLSEARTVASEGDAWVIETTSEDPQLEAIAPMGARAIELTMMVEPRVEGYEPLGEVFWAVDDVPFAAPGSHHRLFALRADAEPHTYTLPLPLGDPAQLDARHLRVRVDPTLFPARITIASLRLVSRPYGPE